MPPAIWISSGTAMEASIPARTTRNRPAGIIQRLVAVTSSAIIRLGTGPGALPPANAAALDTPPTIRHDTKMSTMQYATLTSQIFAGTTGRPSTERRPSLASMLPTLAVISAMATGSASVYQ